MPQTSADPAATMPIARARKPAGAPDRVARYADSLDERLARLAGDGAAMRRLLESQLAFWTGAYRRFVAAIDAGALDPPPDGPDAWDYALVIAEINARFGRLA